MTKIDQKNYAKNSENSLKLIIPSWDQIYNLLLELAKMIQKSGFEPDIIVGVCRGGWIPARILSDLLANQKLANITVEFYEGICETKPNPVITQQVSVSINNRKVLVVDDVADTGKSLKLVNLHLKKKGASEIKIATIYYKPWSSIVPHYYQQETLSWIIFPWERKEATKKIVEKFTNVGINIEYFKENLISFGLNKKLTERFIKELGE